MTKIPDPGQFAGPSPDGPSAADADTDWIERPSRLSAAVFQMKVAVFRVRRRLLNLTAGLRRLTPAAAPEDFVILAEARSGLWTDTRSREHRHQRGKVENLRRATARIGAGLLAPGQVFSFWTQVGKATRRRGFVDGRMIQEGCLVPAIGGGLCQLSNALYDVAQRAGCEIVERHGHSKVVPGSASTHGQDATVAWNYVDLRFRHDQPLHIETWLTETELIVRISGPPAAPARSSGSSPAQHLPIPPAQGARSCDSCQQVSCFRHEGPAPPSPSARRIWLVDDNWPEFQAYRAEAAGPNDLLGVPLDGHRWRAARYGWTDAPSGRTSSAAIQALARSARVRQAGRQGPVRRQAELAGAEAIARSLSRLLTPDDLDVVVAQSLLPYLWRDGRLGGRRFSVLMTRLPMAELQARLDTANQAGGGQASLTDFRAPAGLVRAESEALAAAHQIVTPHAEVAGLFGERSVRLAWSLPKARAPAQAVSGRIAFPGPTIARKGARSVRDAAQVMGLEVVLVGANLEGPNFWEGVDTRMAGPDWLDGVSLVVQPAVVEDSPRRLLAALAAGVPVVATPACGLDQQPGLTLIGPNDTKALVAAIRQALAKGEGTASPMEAMA